MSRVLKGLDASKVQAALRVFNMSEVGPDSGSGEETVRQAARGIIQRARLEAEMIRRQAYAEAEAQARKDVRAEMESTAAREIRQARAGQVDAALKSLRTLAGEIESRRSMLANDSRASLIALALNIAGVVIKREVRCGDDVARLNLEEAIRLSAKHSQLVIHVSSQDVETVRDVLQRTPELSRPEETVEIRPSDEILPGGCLIESASGEVDARIETQLREIEKALLGEEYDV